MKRARLALSGVFIALVTTPGLTTDGVTGPAPRLAATGGTHTRSCTASCPDGSAALEQVLSACFPINCVSLDPLDWGVGGAPPGVISIPKFDPAIGNLVEVELELSFRYAGDACVDNTSPSCCLVSMSANLNSVTTPGAGNDPPVTGFSPIAINDVAAITPPGFLLGPSDGASDCTGTPVGNMSIGDCTPGEDHFITSWDVIYGPPPQVLSSVDDLQPWVRTPGKPLEVEFEVTALGALVGAFCPSLDSFFGNSGKAWFDVTYRFCPPGQGYCFGDPGSGTPCPCNNDNNGSIPGSGCDNGVFPSGAHLTGSGGAYVTADSLVLTTTYLEPLNSSLYFQADNDLSPGQVWGDGLRCAGGNLKRLQVRFADAVGSSSTTIGISGKAGNVLAGDTKRYQCWYRTTTNPPCGPGMNDFNSSNGYQVTWLP